MDADEIGELDEDEISEIDWLAYDYSQIPKLDDIGAAAKRKRDLGVDEMDAAAAVEDDPNLQARKIQLEDRKNQLYKLGFRSFENPKAEIEFLNRPTESESVRLDRIRQYKEVVDEPFVAEDYNDPLFANVWGKPLPLARDEHIKIFNEITAKNNREYRKQHWHMNEVKMGEEQRLVPLRVDPLTFRFHPELWRIDLYGEFTKTLPNTLQICSLKLTSPDDTDYPLKVYGDLTLYYEHKPWQQVIFSRNSDRCQTLTKEDPYLSLTGPYWNPLAPPKTEVYIQANLKLKGTTESDAHKFLCLSAKCREKDLVCRDNFSEYDLDFDRNDPYMHHVSSCCEKKPCECREFGKHYLLEMTRTIVTYSVFASICVQLVGMKPPDQLLSCFITAYSDESSCEEDMKVVLLDCRDGKEEPVLETDKEKEDVYTFELSRQTICVDWQGRLIVYIEHGKTGKELIFKPQLEGEDTQDVDIGSSGSRIQVKVEWSVYWEKSGRLLY